MILVSIRTLTLPRPIDGPGRFDSPKVYLIENLLSNWTQHQTI
jgi:hypothetical protein